MVPLWLEDPAWLALLALLPLVLWWRRRRGHEVAVLPHAAAWSGTSARRSRLPVWLVSCGVVLLAVGLARPQQLDERHWEERRGYDVVLAVDVSGSMLAEDYGSEADPKGRLEVIKPVIEGFLAKRPADRVGIVVFARRAYTLAPLTFDHGWLRRQMADVRAGLIEEGTAVGNALGLAVSRLADSAHGEGGRRTGAFVVLLTDGANNAGLIEPEQAAEVAAALGIPVFAVGVGREGLVPTPVFDRRGRRTGTVKVPSHLDEASLAEIARATGGRFLRAIEEKTLGEALEAIDRTHPIEFEPRVETRARDVFQRVAWPGLALCVAGFALARPGRHP